MNRARIRPHPHVQSHDGANPRQLRNGRGRVDSSLDPSHVRARQSDGSGDFGGGQTAGYASVSEVGANGAQVVSSETRSSVDRPFSGSHAVSVTALAHLTLYAELVRPMAVSAKERTGAQPNDEFVVRFEHPMHQLTIERTRESHAARFVVRYVHPMHALHARARPGG